MTGPVNSPEQAPGTPQPLDVQALVRQRIQEQAALQARGPVIRAATAAEVLRHGQQAGPQPAAGEGVAPPLQPPLPGAPSGEKGGDRVDTGVHVNVTTGGSRKFGSLFALVILAGGGTAYGVAAHQNHWFPWKQARPAAAVANGGTNHAAAPTAHTATQIPSALPSSLALPVTTATGSGQSSAPEASGSASATAATCATPNTSLDFAPATIPQEDRVTGTITNLDIPLDINYVKAGDAKKVVHHIAGAFDVQVSGKYSIAAGAPNATDSKYPAIVYDQPKSSQIGKVVVALQPGYFATKLDLTGATAMPRHLPLTSTDATLQGQEISQFIATHSQPAVTLPPSEALALYHRIVGDPNATTEAAKQGLQAEMVQYAGAAVTKTLLSAPYSTQIAAIYKATFVPLVRQQELDACIPDVMIADTAQYSDFTKMPDMSPQYPMPSDSLISVDTKHIVLSNGQPASGKVPAVPATITVSQAAGK